VIRSRYAVRLGFRQVKGLSEGQMKLLVQRRGSGYDSVRDLWLRSGLPASAIEKLAAADAFRSLGLDRREALWAVKALDAGAAAEGLPLFERPSLPLRDLEPEVALPAMPLGEHVIHDYRALSLSLKAHPVSFLRQRLDRERTCPASALTIVRDGERIEVAGLVLVRQRPGSAKGVIFMTMEDETGVANVIVWPKTFERFRSTVLGARFVRVRGRLQSESGVIHVVASHIEDLTPWLGDLSEAASKIDGLAKADEVKRPVLDGRDRPLPRAKLARLLKEHPPSRHDLETLARRVGAVMPKGRNFQ
jgi:error-prone DNA polymerase